MHDSKLVFHFHFILHIYSTNRRSVSIHQKDGKDGLDEFQKLYFSSFAFASRTRRSYMAIVDVKEVGN